MKHSKRLATLAIVACLGTLPAFSQGEMAATPAELVAAYDSLADSILANMKTERNLVRAILATTYNHAQAIMARIESGSPSREDVELLASLVSQLGNEGDAATAAVRKRLVEGGHHHNAKGEEQGIYDPGFVIVTRAAKKDFLDAAQKIGRQARSPRRDALMEAWAQASKVYQELMAAEKARM